MKEAVVIALITLMIVLVISGLLIIIIKNVKKILNDVKVYKSFNQSGDELFWVGSMSFILLFIIVIIIIVVF